MTKTETLLASVNKAEEKVEKINKTIERHFKQLEKKSAALEKLGYNVDYSEVQFDILYSYEFKKQIAHIEKQKWGEDHQSVNEYWELCDLCHKLEDIHGSHKKLAEAKKILSNWEVKLNKEQEKEVFINNQAPKVIIDFVNSWGELAFEWFMKNEKKPNEESIRKFVENEKRIKIVVLTMRVIEVVGLITDAKYLEIGEKGDLIGIIVGEKGKARVETISAGGWNVQCWHYRTLVQRLVD